MIDESIKAYWRRVLPQPVQRPQLTRAEMAEDLYGKPKDLVRLSGVKTEQIEGGVIRAAVGLRVQPSADKFRRFRVDRDDDRPLEFDGKALGRVEEASHDGAVVTRAALYGTRAGRFIAEFTRFETPGMTLGANVRRPMLFAKAQVFDSREIAITWFRPGGRITKLLLEQLGALESEFIE
jgi:hypothetical protein